MRPGEFHWRDGWYFKRLGGGAVQIRKMAAFDGIVSDTHEFTVEIPAEEWASIVAHVAVRPSHPNEGILFASARQLHSGTALGHKRSTGRDRSEETE